MSVGAVYPGVTPAAARIATITTRNETNPAGRRPRWDNRGTASTVTSIRPGRQITEPRTQSSDNLEEHALYTTAYVKVNC